jgi:glutaminyl-peptide cyclotransferase
MYSFILAIRGIALCSFAFLSLACGDNSAATQPSATPAATETAPAKKTTAFDAERAFNHVKAQVAFGPRPAGSAALAATRDYLVKELTSYGLKVTLDEFTPTTPDKVTPGKTRMANIIAELPGETDNVIAIASHYDTKLFKEFRFDGANDGGSSTGALLEIARIWAQENKAKRKFTYQFVFFDGEEAFCEEWSDCLNGNDNTYGSRHMVERLTAEKKLDKFKALILLDMIGDKDLAIQREDNSTSWLTNVIWQTARESGYGKQFPTTSTAIEDDHVSFLAAGLAAVDLIDFTYGPNLAYWHTKEDTLDKISSQSLKAVGDVVLLSLPKIEALIK